MLNKNNKDVINSCFEMINNKQFNYYTKQQLINIIVDEINNSFSSWYVSFKYIENLTNDFEKQKEFIKELNL